MIFKRHAHLSATYMIYHICNQFENEPDFFELDQSVGLSCNNPLTVLANWKLKSESGCCEAS